MIEKIDRNDNIIVMIDKINEIIDFLNATYFMDKEENKTTISSTNLIINNSETTTINNVKCPHCGESYYRENYTTTTAMYFPPVYKDGVNVNPDRNKSTTHCTCINCGKEFVI